MFGKIPILPSFSLTRKGKVLLLLNEAHKDYLLAQGIEDPKAFLKRKDPSTWYVGGRTPHPSISIPNGRSVFLRSYVHGGLLRLISRNLYLLGFRSFRELALTEEIRSSGISTIEPIGAIHRVLFFPFYQAYLLSLEIPRAINLVQYLQKIAEDPSHQNLLSKRKTIRSAGSLLRQFHQKGFYHGDLQLRNFLTVGEQLFLIDFDRSYRREVLSSREKIRNLLRLNRSAEKWKHQGLLITRTDRWRFLLAYAQGDTQLQETVKKKLRAHSRRLFFHRLAWAFPPRSKPGEISF